MDKQLSVVAVLGISFSGSTLLNIMLDSFPGVYGGGELHYLVRQEEYRPTCTHCGDHCSVWTAETLRKISKQNFYSSIADLMGVDIIVDTGKSPVWFIESMTYPSDREIRFIPVLLVKHPIRHIASILINNGFAKDSLTPDHAKTRGADAERESVFNTIIENRIIPEYNSMFSFLRDRFNGHAVLVQYEQLIQDTPNALSPLLSALDVNYTDSCRNCYRHIHHQIGGNSGTIYQQTEDPSHIESLGPIYSEWYKRVRGLSLDNKYKSIFTQAEIDRFNANEHIRRMNQTFSYTDLN